MVVLRRHSRLIGLGRHAWLVVRLCREPGRTLNLNWVSVSIVALRMRRDPGSALHSGHRSWHRM